MTNRYFVVQKLGKGLCRTIFQADFEILDLNPPNNPTSHYGVCHFGYSLTLNVHRELQKQRMQDCVCYSQITWSLRKAHKSFI